MATFKKYTTKKGEFWEVKGYLGIEELTGKQKNIQKRGFKSKKEAEKFYKNSVYEFEKGIKQVREKSLTFEEVYNLWLENYSMTVKESTLRTVKGFFCNHILVAFGSIKIDKLTIEYVQKIANQWCLNLNIYKPLINYTFKVLSFAFQRGYNNKNLKVLFIMPHKQKNVLEKKEENFLNKQELINLLGIIKKEYDLKRFLMFHLLAYTGMRKGELLALTWDNINFKEKTININKTLSVNQQGNPLITIPKTKNSIRTIGIDDESIHLLKKWRLEQSRLLMIKGINTFNSSEQIVFTTRSNKLYSLDYLNGILNKIIRKHNLPKISVHGLRHTHATILFESNLAPKLIQERLGHSDIATTLNIYTHVSENSNHDSIQSFVNYMEM